MLTADKKNLTAEFIIDNFITDCMLPSTTNTIQAANIYEVFTAYCEQMGVAVPCRWSRFGFFMGKRFQRRTVNGLRQYFCEFRPGLFTVDEHEPLEGGINDR